MDLAAVSGAASTTNVGASTSAITRLAQVEADFATSPADYLSTGPLPGAVSSLQVFGSGFASSLQQMIQGSLVSQADADTPLPALTPAAAVQQLAVQMLAGSSTIKASVPAVGGQTNAFTSPVGNPVFVWSVKDGAGRTLQYVFPETITAAITQDSQNGATAGQEPYTVTGQNANGNPLSWDWLKSGIYGSGTTGQGTLIDPSVSNTASTSSAGGTNLTVNGTFTTYTTANQPDNWTIVTGAAGSTILNGTGTVYYTGQGSVEMVSNGATALAITQAFNTASSTGVGTGGTPYALIPSAVNNTEYAVFVAYKLSIASPAAGVLRIELIDGAAATVADDASTNNRVDVDLTAVGDTNWHTITTTFRLPQALPASTPYKLKIWQQTAVTNGKNLYIGAVGVAVMNMLYAGGPYFVAFRGSTNPNASGVQRDAWTFAVTNTMGKLQKAMWRWFNVPALAPMTPGLIIPNATGGGESVSDTTVA